VRKQATARRTALIHQRQAGNHYSALHQGGDFMPLKRLEPRAVRRVRKQHRPATRQMKLCGRRSNNRSHADASHTLGDGVGPTHVAGPFRTRVPESGETDTFCLGSASDCRGTRKCGSAVNSAAGNTIGNVLSPRFDSEPLGSNTSAGRFSRIR
jgi:hypothetical protein